MKKRTRSKTDFIARLNRANSKPVPADQEAQGAVEQETLKQAIRDSLSPEGVATMIAFLQPATMYRAPTEEAQKGLRELEWFTDALINLLGSSSTTACSMSWVCKPKRPLGRRGGWLRLPPTRPLQTATLRLAGIAAAENALVGEIVPE